MNSVIYLLQGMAGERDMWQNRRAFCEWCLGTPTQSARFVHIDASMHEHLSKSTAPFVVSTHGSRQTQVAIASRFFPVRRLVATSPGRRPGHAADARHRVAATRPVP